MLIRDLFNTIRLLGKHPLSQNRILPVLVRYIRWQIGSRLVPGSVATKFVNNSMLLAKPGMTGSTGNVYVGLHEFEEMSFVLHLLRPDDLFVDVGANVGSYTILAGACSAASCISFEPNPQTFSWLKRNVDINGIADKTELHCTAVGSTEGTATFTIDLGCGNHLVQGASRSTEKQQEVPVLTLDGAINGREPLLLKIDVEGFETDVINGGKSVLNSPNLRCIIMELVGHGKNYGFDEDGVRKEINSLGFEEYHYSPFERKLTKSDEYTRSANTIFIRDLSFVKQRLESAEPFSVLNISV